MEDFIFYYKIFVFSHLKFPILAVKGVLNLWSNKHWESVAMFQVSIYFVQKKVGVTSFDLFNEVGYMIKIILEPRVFLKKNVAHIYF